MSDKSKLGFNINPKNYDELNSTDNLITSGSDSGWLGKKLQGDDSNDLDLSKINPLFDKDLYEKYRPGVNTNDGSVNQDIWGYKCFNSPVSFRNGIYGDTYSIQSVEDGDKTIGISSGISIQTYQKNTTNNVSTLDNKHYSYNVYFESEIFGLKENKYIASTYTGNLLVDTFRRTVNNYQLFYNSYVNGSSIENISSRDSNGYSYDYCKLYTFNNPKNTELSIYNGIDIYSKINKNNEYNDEINIASSKCDTSGSRFPYKVSRITVGTDCSADTTLEQEQSVSGNCIRMYSANGNEHGVDYTNDNISSIIITPEIINTSVDNKIITIDYHTDKLTGDDYNYSKPVIDIAFDYTKVTDDPANLILFQMASLLNIQDATVSDAEDAVPSINVHGIFKNGNDDVIKYRGTRITPTSIAVNAIQFNRFIMGDTFISNTHNKLVPVEYIFKQNDTDETGTNTYGLKLLSCDGKLKTSFICDYLVVNESIKYKSTVSYTDRLVYIDPETNNTTNVLTVQSNNLILPRGNKEVTIGSSDNQLNEIYADRLKGTADRATSDYYGNDIRDTYVIKLNNYKNDIQSCNAIIGSGERLFFFNEPCIENSIESPEDIPKPYISMGASYEDNGVTSKNVFSWTNKDNSVTRKCIISSKYDYDASKSTASFCVYPEKAQSSDIADIGMAGAMWSNIWCKRLLCDEVRGSQFPTIVGSTDGTSVGNIRLLCIKAPTASQTLERTIEPGEAFEYPVTLSDNRPINPYSIKCTIHIAKFKVTDNSNQSIGIDPGAQVAGKWVALSSTYINANSANISLCFPILAMRVE